MRQAHPTDYKMKQDCAHCGVKLVGVIYFCNRCWWRIPAADRSQLGTMHRDGQDTTTKVQRCLRVLRQKDQRAEEAMNLTDENRPRPDA